MFEEAITWCNKGLAVSFISYYSHIFLFDCGEAELPGKKWRRQILYFISISQLKDGKGKMQLWHILSLSLFHFCISPIILIYIPGITKINWQYIVENENSDDKDSNEDDNNKQKEQKIKFHFPKLLEDWPEQPEVSGLEERVCRRTKETSRNTCSRRELEGWVGYPNRDTKGKLDLIFFYLRKASLKI